MTALIFLIFAGIAVICGISLVAQTHPIASALSLIGVMGSLAVLYLQLGGEFIAMAQMLLNAGAETAPRHVSIFTRYLGVVMLAAFLGLISFVIQALLPKSEGVVFGAFQGGTALAFGRKLFTVYLLPFEVTSVLILIAILGAIVLARREV